MFGAHPRRNRMTELPGYRHPASGTQPEYLHPAYASSVKRSPRQALIPLPHTLSEITGPVYGHDQVRPEDNDLTKGHAGQPLGERIIVTGRVLDEDGRPVANTLVELWQCSASGRYHHPVDQH